jgi:hypothetical protein
MQVVPLQIDQITWWWWCLRAAAAHDNEAMTPTPRPTRRELSELRKTLARAQEQLEVNYRLQALTGSAGEEFFRPYIRDWTARVEQLSAELRAAESTAPAA